MKNDLSIPKEEVIENLLSRNVSFFKPESEIIHLKKRLASGEKLRIKFGIDPTGPRIHLGRAATLLKLRDFQQLGHIIVLIIGDFTALVGDPSDKLSGRSRLTPETIEMNMKHYLPQIGRIININTIEARCNSLWLSKVKMSEILTIFSHFSFTEMADRENFDLRLRMGNHINLREFIYPILQGYDSLVTQPDIEVGGNDQLFNMLCGRKIQEIYGQKKQLILGTKLINSIDGTKMSTSIRNCIYIDEDISEIKKKILRIANPELISYFECLTRLDMNMVKLLVKKDPQGARQLLVEKIIKIFS